MVAVHGVKLDQGVAFIETAPLLRAALTPLLHRPVELDLAELEFMDSSGLNAPLSHHCHCRPASGRSQVVSTSRPAQRLLDLTGTREPSAPAPTSSPNNRTATIDREKRMFTSRADQCWRTLGVGPVRVLQPHWPRRRDLKRLSTRTSISRAATIPLRQPDTPGPGHGLNLHSGRADRGPAIGPVMPCSLHGR
ncbi:STAS domain-containing protein [Streptomyces sp. NPDC052000]|uniref:STAS domain-containing protein n=1 Tax=Streptomyces sp. NPDC052000 TaxID=3155676 RepID=UPI00345044C0